MAQLRFRPAVSLLLALCGASLLAAVAGCGPSGSGATVTYAITFSLSETPAPLDALSFDVAYNGGGGFDGQDTAVQCTRTHAASGATASFQDDDVTTLTVALTAGSTPMDAVEPVVRCLFSADVQPTTANFTVTVTKALDENENDVSGQTQVLVTSIVEDHGGTGTDHFLTFSVTSAHASVGSLSFNVDFTGSSGAFAVSDQLADCTNLVTNSALAASVIAGQLRIGVISLDGFDTPADIARCRFIAVTAPTSDEFNINVTGATTVSDVTITPTVAISSITTGSAQ